MEFREARTLEVQFTVSHSSHTSDLDRITHLLRIAAESEGIHGQLGIWLCTDEEIADLHLRFMNIPGATDVITFSGDPPDSGGYLGDIAVSVDTAGVQAEDAGHSPEREIAYLCLHGLLHIAGYDDLDETGRERMLRRQEELLNGFEHENPGAWRVATLDQSRDDNPE